MKPVPTTRAVLEPSLVCNIKCKMCYHLHRYDTWNQTVKSLDEMKVLVDSAKNRGNDFIDITGGEPTMYPHIVKLVKYIRNQNMGCCIITNGIMNPAKSIELVNMGLSGYLVSRHGLRDTHNEITNYPNAYDKQLKFLDSLPDEFNLRFNCVISKYNQSDLLEIAEEMIIYKPKIVNFINMNPHHEWMSHTLELKDVVANLRESEKVLNETIEFLNYNHVAVNLRYYPMCRIKQEHRRCVCNDLHVTFDPYEWDYDIQPKTFEQFKQWGIQTSNCVEEKGEPCNKCDLQKICGGINKGFHKIANELYGEVCDPINDIPVGDPNNFYYYRDKMEMVEPLA